ncbi:hypothetical protein FA13DRAFT_250920 [Coprinellus micaceus]|uniref:Uncharacterized protein n=1 Tax=Coprinellus micaceus TaxID=71717 RepID=A0A4Y7TDY6_COPMI|nr:hypothetical protein FA13DRAFT_250920 [Coprinellus micaceus]
MDPSFNSNWAPKKHRDLQLASWRASRPSHLCIWEDQAPPQYCITTLHFILWVCTCEPRGRVDPSPSRDQTLHWSRPALLTIPPALPSVCCARQTIDRHYNIAIDSPQGIHYSFPHFNIQRSNFPDPRGMFTTTPIRYIGPEGELGRHNRRLPLTLYGRLNAWTHTRVQSEVWEVRHWLK